MRFFGVNFILQKLCQCKKNDNYKVCSMSGNRGAFSSLPEMALPTQNKYTLNNEEKGQRNHFWPLQSGSFMRNTEERRFLSKLSLDFVI